MKKYEKYGPKYLIKTTILEHTDEKVAYWGKRKNLLKKKSRSKFCRKRYYLPSGLREGVSENSLEIFNRLCKQICISMFWSKTKKNLCGETAGSGLC